MEKLDLQYIEDETHTRRAVIVPLDQWERILEELEELDDIRAYDEAKRDGGEAISFEQAVREIREPYQP